MIGKTLAHYELSELLGKGGMGEVFRARDTKLDRDVAIKLLPLDFASDPERMSRFRREAKLLASLNHPNIAGIHGLEEAEGQHFLVMELAEGEDLSQRIQRGAIPMDEALEISRQIAEGLEEAHEKGIVHRDLKPGNIRLAADGKVKILDFGLARAFVGEAVDEQDLHNSPTITNAMTQPGVILGTAAYMSPEQAKGKTVDRRADLWSFGVILWEMLTGQRLFTGETVSDTLAAVLRADPPYDELPEGTPPAVKRLLGRCLERDPRKRLRDIGEARIRIERWQSDPTSLLESGTSLFAEPEESRSPSWLPWAIAGLGLTLAIAAFVFRGSAPESAPPRLAVDIELQYQDLLQSNVATNVLLTPDGQLMAYLARNHIQLRRLDSRETRTLQGTQDARIACFSPDGQWMAFTGQGKLRRISVTGGSPVEICEAPDSRGVCWVNETTLVFNPTFAAPLQVVSLSDGIARPLTELQEGERSHRWPHALPDGKSILFMCQYFGRDYDEGDIMMLDLESGERKVVYRGGASPRYAPTGHLLFAREQAVFAIPFDMKSGTTHGLATPVIDRVWTSVGDQEACDGSAQYAISDNGILVYRIAPVQALNTQLTWVDLATGEREPLGPVANQISPTLSPDGRKLAVMRGSRDEPEIYILDLVTGAESRLTFESGGNQLGCWSPDSRDVYYTRPTEQGIYVIYRKAADGSGMEEEITRSPQTITPDDVSPDNRTLYITSWNGGYTWDISTLDLEDPDQGIQALVSSPAMQYFAQVSPDGQWMLYHESVGDSWHLYLRRVPDTGGRWEILQSTTQPQHAIWGEDGTTIYTRDGRGFLKIELRLENGSVQAKPPQLLQLDEGLRSSGQRTSGTLADGSRGLMMMTVEDGEEEASRSESPIVLMTDWFEELERKVPIER